MSLFRVLGFSRVVVPFHTFPYGYVAKKKKEKKEGKRKKRIKKEEEEKRVMIRPTIGLEQEDSGVEMRFFSKVEDIGRPRKFGR